MMKTIDDIDHHKGLGKILFNLASREFHNGVKSTKTNDFETAHPAMIEAKQAISQLIQEAIPELKSVEELFGDKTSKETDALLASQVLQKNMYNQAIKEITERLKERGLL